jgi:hypothetical protein
MPVTLAEFNRGTVPDLDRTVINEFRKANPFLNLLTFDDVVNPAGGGATWTYSYRRQVTQASATFRAINTEYTPSEVTTAVFSSSLAPLGGSYQIDRVLAENDSALASENALQMQNKIQAASTFFNDQVINGDTAVNAAGFDGLNKSLLGSSTEFGTTAVTDWSDWDTNPSAVNKSLDAIDEFLSSLDGQATIVAGNRAVIARVRAAARRAGQYVKSPVDGLVTPNGVPFERELYGGIQGVDAGNTAGSNDPVIPIRSATVGGVASTGLTDLYAVRMGLDGFHGITFTGRSIVRTWLPDFSTAGAVKTGEVELGPVGVALKATRAAAVLRNIKVR